MSLGETIYQLRTKQNLSQGDLADRLGLSRQSVSKWENNSAVPDLDNLVKLSEIFDVSLDELVKGETGNVQSAVPTQSKVPSMPPLQPFPMRKLIGILLFCMAFVAFLLFTIYFDLLNGLIFAAPFLVFGIICVVCKRHTGLKCGWALYLFIDLFFGFGSSMWWHTTYAMFQYPPESIVLILSLLMFSIRVGLIIFTVRAYKETATINTKRRFLLWGLYTITCIGCILIGLEQVYLFLLDNLRGMLDFWQFLCALLAYCRIFLFTASLITTIRYRKTKKQV